MPICSAMSSIVSTHSRPKAAGDHGRDTVVFIGVSTHSRPKAAGHVHAFAHICIRVSTHSRPKAAGPCCRQPDRQPYRFNTQPPEGGWILG